MVCSSVGSTCSGFWKARPDGRLLLRELGVNRKRSGVARSVEEVCTAWPEIVSEDLKDSCVREFLAGTSTDALREYVCSVCGEGVTSASLHPEGVPFSDVHLDLFRTGFKRFGRTLCPSEANCSLPRLQYLYAAPASVRRVDMALVMPQVGPETNEEYRLRLLVTCAYMGEKMRQATCFTWFATRHGEPFLLTFRSNGGVWSESGAALDLDPVCKENLYWLRTDRRDIHILCK